MNEQAHHGILQEVGGESEETNNSPTNTTDHGINNILENGGLDRSLSDPVRYLDQHRMLMEQENAMMALKVSEYENALAEKDLSIESLHTDMINYQNNNYILTNQYKSLMESTKSLNATGMGLNTCFKNISERLNRLEDTLDNVTKRQKEVLITNNTFQDKVIRVSSNIDSLFNQVNIDKIKAKEELDDLLNKHSLECITYKTNLEECVNKIENMKSENDTLNRKLNATNIELNEEKESVLKKIQYFEKKIKDTTDQNVLLINDIKVITDNYDVILTENQYLKDEITKMKMSLNENEKQLDLKLKTIEDQSKLFDNLKQSEELNDMLKKNNFTLKERIEYLEKINNELMDDISNNIVYQNTIQEENENKYKHTLKDYEEKILQLNKELKLQKENEFTVKNEVIDLKQEVQNSNNTITNLQDELKLNLTLIPQLQNKIDNLNNDLTLSYKKLQDCSTELETEKNKLEKEKNELENQFKEQNLKLTETTANYIKYKSKVMPLYSEVLRLRQKCLLFEQKKSSEHHLTETIEEDDVSNTEFVGEDISNKHVLSVSYNTNQSSLNCSSKRNSLYIDNTSLKKHKTSNDMGFCQVLSPEKESYMENESKKNQVTTNTSSNVSVKKLFKIPVELRPAQDKMKSTLMRKNDMPKPNSPVPITTPTNETYGN
ncbi:Hypothetical protein CINCED_3A025852 [Cinara cedri]|uniref:Uncharacterized protein n=1 Tax=Cinara cedri TaxID=506608 RepID=A0A5E4M2U8_9HEMI|nr:Hypothetical protein CINCED_3A025852 [Cinara cedri]